MKRFFRKAQPKQETGNRKPEKGNRRQETGDRKLEKGNRRQETGDWKNQNLGLRHKIFKVG